MNTRPHTDHAADLLRADLRTIRHCWDAIVPKLRAVRTGHGPAGPRTSTPKDDDNGDHNTDVSALDVVLSARGTTLAVLNGWSRVVIEDKPVTTALPRDGHDVHELAEFLDRWAGWLVEHEAAPAAIEEIHECAQSIERLLPHGRKDWVWIGDCPITLAHDGEQIVCGAPIRVYPHQEIRCPHCGTSDTLDWWITKIVGTDQPVTAEQLIPILHRRLGIHITTAGIRQWVARGIVEPIKIDDQPRTDERGRTLFDRNQVIQALMLREQRRHAGA